MFFNKEWQDKSILPEKNTDCPVNDQCWNFFNYEEVTLLPNEIRLLDLGLFCFTNKEDKNGILKIQQHLCDKPWRILGDYFIPNQLTITVPVIAKKKCKINEGEVLFHATIISLTTALQLIKGKNFYK